MFPDVSRVGCPFLRKDSLSCTLKFFFVIHQWLPMSATVKEWLWLISLQVAPSLQDSPKSTVLWIIDASGVIFPQDEASSEESLELRMTECFRDFACERRLKGGGSDHDDLLRWDLGDSPRWYYNARLHLKTMRLGRKASLNFQYLLGVAVGLNMSKLGCMTFPRNSKDHLFWCFFT